MNTGRRMHFATTKALTVHSFSQSKKYGMCNALAKLWTAFTCLLAGSTGFAVPTTNSACTLKIVSSWWSGSTSDFCSSGRPLRLAKRRAYRVEGAFRLLSYIVGSGTSHVGKLYECRH